MTVTPLAITSTGMVTAVGLDTPSTCAAIRCAIDNFQETRFMDEGGEWQIGAEVELEKPWRGRTKLLEMLAMSLLECIERADLDRVDDVPLLLSLPEKDRPGRTVQDDDQFFRDLQQKLDLQFSPLSKILCYGHTAAAIDLKHSREILENGQATHVIIAGVDSLLSAPALRQYQEEERLLTSRNSNGFIPGEGAASFVVEKATNPRKAQLHVHGLGFAIENAKINSELPLRADGLRSAINASLSETGCEMHDLEYRITDMTGEHYYFKEASLALSRTLKKVVPEFDILHPTDCVGELGAAAGHIIFCYQNYLSEKGTGDAVIAHFGDADGKRSAAVVSYPRGGS